MKKILTTTAATALLVAGLTSCTADDSDVVNHNITKAAKNFEVNRRIVVVNGITDNIQLQVEGRCDIEPKKDRTFITCKVAEGESADSYVRHQVYKSDNVFIVVEQGEPIKASAYHYRFTYKPQSIIPDPDFRGSMADNPLKEQ